MTRLVFALLLAAPLAIAAPVPKIKPKAAPFPHTVGTKWEYTHDGDGTQVWVEEVVECEEKDGAVTFKVDITPPAGGKRFEVYRLKDGELVLTATQAGTYDPPMLIAKVGMKPGDEWVNKIGQKGRGGKVEYEVTLTVGKAEELSTPAGKFTATPVTRGYTNGLGKTTFWFADGVGMVRQTTEGETEPNQDLKSFTPGKR
ncbi:MAG: hypothetical protein MUF18_06165 [Fimbriiglobus sp.]|jgi:hypothetical protein|nr:hypothetical protein [Fimbriiglobus sp.]